MSRLFGSGLTERPTLAIETGFGFSFTRLPPSLPPPQHIAFPVMEPGGIRVTTDEGKEGTTTPRAFTCVVPTAGSNVRPNSKQWLIYNNCTGQGLNDGWNSAASRPAGQRARGIMILAHFKLSGHFPNLHARHVRTAEMHWWTARSSCESTIPSGRQGLRAPTACITIGEEELEIQGTTHVQHGKTLWSCGYGVGFRSPA